MNNFYTICKSFGISVIGLLFTFIFYICLAPIIGYNMTVGISIFVYILMAFSLNPGPYKKGKEVNKIRDYVIVSQLLIIAISGLLIAKNANPTSAQIMPGLIVIVFLLYYATRLLTDTIDRNYEYNKYINSKEQWTIIGLLTTLCLYLVIMIPTVRIYNNLPTYLENFALQNWLTW
ncbi:hypothetical protein HOL24_12015 [bacterium]|jgi:hypothetical protein|nr:hypothetical protein [bacterium]